MTRLWCQICIERIPTKGSEIYQQPDTEQQYKVNRQIEPTGCPEITHESHTLSSKTLGSCCFFPAYFLHTHRVISTCHGCSKSRQHVAKYCKRTCSRTLKIASRDDRLPSLRIHTGRLGTPLVHFRFFRLAQTRRTSPSEKTQTNSTRHPELNRCGVLA